MAKGLDLFTHVALCIWKHRGFCNVEQHHSVGWAIFENMISRVDLFVVKLYVENNLA